MIRKRHQYLNLTLFIIMKELIIELQTAIFDLKEANSRMAKRFSKPHVTSWTVVYRNKARIEYAKNLGQIKAYESVISSLQNA